MPVTAVVILIVFSLGASFTQRVTGFGFGIFIMTVLPHIMPSYAEATALSGMLALISAAITVAALYRSIEWKKLWLILLTFLAVSFFSVRLVSGIEGQTLKRILGGLLVLISMYFFIFGGHVKMKTTAGVQVGMGSLSGIMGGLFAMQGPPAVIYFISCSDSKDAYIALTSAYFFIGNCMMTLFRAANGFVTHEVWVGWLIGLPAVLIGLIVGEKVCDLIPVNTLRKVVYAFLAASGVFALFAL